MQKHPLIPKVFAPFVPPMRYKVAYGGRGSGKSHTVAMLLLILGGREKKRILCTREYQTSIKDSVHKLLCDKIDQYEMSGYEITRDTIRHSNGTEFLFKGLHHNINEIKSTEGIDIAWVEEAQSVSNESWNILTPTVRQPDSEIWIVFNPNSPDDATYNRFITHKPDNCTLIKANWYDNPFFPDVLNAERIYDQKHNDDIYAWKWEGEPRSFTDAQVFRGKFEVVDTIPDIDIWLYGADWGFSNDPSVLVKVGINDGQLWIVDAKFGYHTEITSLAELFDTVPGSRRWPIKADSARPETISHVARQGFKISAAKKWPGSVEDGIEYMRGFKKINIHYSLKEIIEEFRLYSYKIDRNTGDVLPVIVDKYNHGIDAIRYALDGRIKNRGTIKAPGYTPEQLGV